MSLWFFSGHVGENARGMRGAYYRFVLIPFHFIIQFVPGYLFCMFVIHKGAHLLCLILLVHGWLCNVFPQEGAIFRWLFPCIGLWFFGYPSEGTSIQFDMSFL